MTLGQLGRREEEKKKGEKGGREGRILTFDLLVMRRMIHAGYSPVERDGG